jgi:hypothetical protein
LAADLRVALVAVFLAVFRTVVAMFFLRCG